jgi:hypothetical protein
LQDSSARGRNARGARDEDTGNEGASRKAHFDNNKKSFSKNNKNFE